ncbi:MAG: DUF3987 domain-containing protein, partial [Rickettsiales bacterium]|nr:DUF3987 domain-containing protein [Rickettsiales bacterium]
MTATSIKDRVEKATSMETLWHKPDVSLVKEVKQPAPAFPLEFLPEGWRKWVLHSATAKNCPPDFIAHSLFIGVAGMLGNAVAVQAWKQWQEPCILWGALVGLPSTGKSPAVDVIMDVIRKLETESAETYTTTVRDYEAKKEIAKQYEAAWQEQVKKAVKNGGTIPPKPENAIAPEEPIRSRIIVTDATSEKTAILLSKTPKG